jgi:hypoxanthine-guanine phosphoribosyltransferase
VTTAKKKVRKIMNPLEIKGYDETLRIIKGLIKSKIIAPDEIRMLISLFDNERSDYASNQRLELGGILLSRTEIIELAKRQAQTLKSEIQSDQDIVFFWSKWSAKEYVTQLSQFLQGIIANTVRDIGINTRWIREGTVAIIENPKILPSSDDLVYCVDFLTGSGGTLECLHDLLQANQVRVRSTLVMINKPTPKKVFIPVLTEPYVTVEDDYWVFGYGSDSRIDGIEVGRKLPFLACLVPEGQGIRERLLMDL